jgi:hypothetical protein
MPEFRAYILDLDGHIKQRIDLLCEDGSAAAERAKQLIDGHDVELWQGDRQIGIFAAGPE